MAYNILATSQTPALIIYLLDISASMNSQLGNKRRIDVILDALSKALRQMVFRSTKGKIVSPRYRIAMYAYSDKVYDLLDGIRTIRDVASLGVPNLSPQKTTNTFKAFTAAERLLEAELPNMKSHPAPLICHMTDGEYNGEDPQPVVQRIKQMSVPDGYVLIENIFISNEIVAQKIRDPYAWPGVTMKTSFQNQYAVTLRNMSSRLPDSYRKMMQESNYHMDKNAVMMLPGMTPELVAMGFQMSAATPIR